MADTWNALLAQSFVVISWTICFSCCAKIFNHEITDVPTTRPLIIAHRGSSGSYPEHTIPAYKKAIVDGADVIECDIVITKDLELVCLHDPYLSDTTDVAQHPEFKSRKRYLQITTPEMEYGEMHDWFSFDFTLAELRTLGMVQRYDFRNQQYNGEYHVVTLSEFIEIVKSADRRIAIYPEMKAPEFYNSLDIVKNSGKRVEDLLLRTLTNYGYTQPDDPCMIQSFTESCLEYLSTQTQLKLTMLIWKDEHYITADGRSKIPEWGRKFYGIGFWTPQIAVYYDFNSSTEPTKNWISGQTTLVNESHAAHLKVHLYTFRNEDRFLPWDFNQDPHQEYRYYMKMEIDAYFTDFPGTLKRVLDQEYAENVMTNSDKICGDKNGAAWRVLLSQLVVITLTATVFYIVH